MIRFDELRIKLEMARGYDPYNRAHNHVLGQLSWSEKETLKTMIMRDALDQLYLNLNVEKRA